LPGDKRIRPEVLLRKTAQQTIRKPRRSNGEPFDLKNSVDRHPLPLKVRGIINTLKLSLFLAVYCGKYELCGNPWNGRCESTEITLYVYFNGVTVPVVETAGTRLRRQISRGV